MSWPMLVWAIIHAAPVIGWALLAGFLGTRLLTRLELRGTYGAERVVVGGVIGLGLLATLAFGLGLLGLLYWPLVATVTAAAALALPRPIASAAGTWRGPAIALALSLLPTLWLALYPPIAFDALVYHLPYASAFAQSHGVPFLPRLRFPVFPQLTELLFALSMQTGDDVAPALFSLLFLALCAGLVFVWSRRLASRRAAWLASAVFLGHPLLHWLGATAHVEIALTAFVGVACLAYHRQQTGDGWGWPCVAGLGAGFAAATKYSGLYFAGVLAVGFALDPRRQRRRPDLGLFLTCFVLAAGPWYVRNMAHTGNPIFPFAPGVFGASAWSRELAAIDQIDSGVPPNYVLWQRGIGDGWQAEAWRALSLPLQLAANRLNPNHLAPVSPLAALLLPVALIAGLREPRLRLLALAGCGYFASWFVGARSLHYLGPPLLLASVALAPAADALCRWYGNRRFLVALTALVLAAPGPLYAVYRNLRSGPLPTTPAASAIALGRELPGYDAVTCLHRLARPAPELYGLFAENLTHHAGNRFCGDWFGPCNFRTVVDLLPDPARLHAHLRGLGSDYFLTLQPLPWPEPQPPGFSEIYRCGSTRLFGLLPPATPARAAMPTLPCVCPALVTLP